MTTPSHIVEEPESGGLSFSGNRPLIKSSKLPTARGGTSGVFVDGKLVVFGGTFLKSEGKYEYLDETWILDVEKLLWHRIQCTGQIPAPRYGHSAHLFGSRMFIFGGRGPHNTVYKDIYYLDLIEWIWVPVNPISRGPSGRFFFASECVGRKMVIQGGWDGNEIFDDLWVFNTDSFAWMQPRTTGFAPTPRYGHTLTLTSDGRLLTFGGCTISKDTDYAPKYNDDVRQLDTETMVWTRPRVNGHCPTGRYGHTAVLIGPDRSKLAIFGGWGKGGNQSQEFINDFRAFPLQILDTNEMVWYVPRKLGKKPIKHLYNHVACVAGSSMFLFGGFDGQQSSRDFIVINLDSSNH